MQESTRWSTALVIKPRIPWRTQVHGCERSVTRDGPSDCPARIG